MQYEIHFNILLPHQNCISFCLGPKGLGFNTKAFKSNMKVLTASFLSLGITKLDFVSFEAFYGRRFLRVLFPYFRRFSISFSISVIFFYQFPFPHNTCLYYMTMNQYPSFILFMSSFYNIC